MTEITVGVPDHAGPPNPAFEQPEPAERIDLLAPPTASEMSGKSPLQQLAETLSDDPEDVEPVRLRVPRRKGVELEFDPSRINKTNRKAWQKRVTKSSRRPGTPDEVDDFLFACLVLANTHTATLMNGQVATDTEGTPLTFAHAQLWGMVGAHDPQECIEKLWKNDQHVTAASGEVLLASGIDDDLASTDPTQG